ncbi:MAG: SDR family NAD(P)-dependent oxidoreductase [Nanoarchaeota archaeon]
MEFGLENKVAIVTGGSRGIGKAIVNALVDEGVYVDSISRTGGAFDHYADLSTIQGLELARKYIEQIQPNILINNVGGVGNRPERFKNYEEAYNMNVRPMLELTDEALKYRLERVITISSIYGKEGGLNPWFTSAKAYQIAWNKEMARKYRGKINFNIVAPGHINTGKEFPDNPEIIGSPEDVANLVTFLCSEKAKHITGACIVVDGGESYSF